MSDGSITGPARFIKDYTILANIPQTCVVWRNMNQDYKGRAGDYELIELVGDGAQGQVFRARCAVSNNQNVQLDQIVAVKVLSCLDSNEASRTRIEKTTDILRRLSHGNVVRYLDAFQWNREWDETRCLVTAFLDGETLQRKLQAAPDGLSWDSVTSIFAQCLDGLIYTREQGIVHRDLKPSNIFILSDGTVKLIDFDIARREGAATTTTKGWLGSFDYMAPDFARLDDFRGDEQSDIFSLGVCFYQALTGKLPFQKLSATADMDYLHRWKSEKDPDPSFQHPVFRILEKTARDFARRSIHPDRSQRHQTFAMMREQLGRIRRRTITGRDTYELESILGRGGFGEVYRARRVSDNRPVAIKWLFAELHSRRFIKEAQLLHRLQHPNTVEYVDFVELEDVGGRQHYFLVMEFLEGMPGWTLRGRIRNSKAGLDTIEALELFSNYLGFLQHLHEHKIIHRDIKPANLYAPCGNPAGARVFDLGIARDISGTATAGYVPGTLDYMPPELATGDGGRGSPQSDIYSTGLSLYEALTGRPAYKRLPAGDKEAFKQFLRRTSQSTGETVDFGIHPFGEYPALAAIVSKAISVRPKGRYASAADMKKAIDEARGAISASRERTTAGHSVEQRDTMTTLPLPPGPGDASKPDASIRSYGLSPANLRKAIAFGSMSAAAGIVLGLGLLWFLREKPRASAVAKPTTTAAIAPTSNADVVITVPQHQAKPEPARPAQLTRVIPPAKPPVAKIETRTQEAAKTAPTVIAGPPVKPAQEEAIVSLNTSQPVKYRETGRVSAVEPDRDKPKETTPTPAKTTPRIRLDLTVATTDPPTSVTYRPSGDNGWQQVDTTRPPGFLDPGNYSFLFARQDYESVETSVAVNDAADAIAIAGPLQWKEEAQLTALRRVEKAWSSDQRDFSTLDTVFTGPPPVFEWPAHETRYRAVRDQWVQAGKIRNERATEAAERSVADYLAWLYKVHDPTLGTYRRYREPMPALSFAALKLMNAGDIPEDELRAQYQRLAAWAAAESTLRNQDGQKTLAISLRQCASELKLSSPQQSGRCLLEAAMLDAKPGEFGASFEKATQPVDVLVWRAHARYTPRTSSLHVLRDLAQFADNKGITTFQDVRLTLYSAYYTWHNAIAGERQYAAEVSSSLGRVLGVMDRQMSRQTIDFLAADITRRSLPAEPPSSSLYMMEALSFIPGLAQGSEIKQQAQSWINEHRNEQTFMEKESKISSSLQLLRSLLKVSE